MNPDSPNRIASLDGLRAVSIALVLFSHLVGTDYFPLPVEVGRFFGLGELGVRVFFVISGFLITNLLLQEMGKTGRIHLGKFYFRRTFRIFPPYYALILILIILSIPGWIGLTSLDALTALTYTANYYNERSWNIGHTWSLAVEEQFYLLWPAVLLLAGKRKGLIAAAALIVFCPLIRLLLWYLAPDARPGIGARFETVADSLAVGVVLAGIRPWLSQQSFYSRILNSRLIILAPVAVLLASALHDRPRLSFLFGFSLMNFGIALTLDWCVTNSEGRIGRFLNWRPIVFIGVMSYSIYLWQQLFLNRYSDSFVTKFPLNIVLVGLSALASYYVVERPSLRMRQKLETRLFGKAPTRTRISEDDGREADVLANATAGGRV